MEQGSAEIIEVARLRGAGVAWGGGWRCGGWRSGGLAVVAGSRRRGGGGGGAVVEVLQVQFIDKVVDVLMQLKFQQSRVCTGSSSTERGTFQLRSERVRTVQTVQKTVLGVDVPVINSDKFLHPQSGGHSCCAAEHRRNSTGAVLGCLVDMPVYVQRQVPRSWMNVLIFCVKSGHRP